jgi:hypothetical protein
MGTPDAGISPEFPYGDPTAELSIVWLYASSPSRGDEGEASLDLSEEIAMARRGELPTGKWLIFAPSESVARIWNTVASAVSDGRLGDLAKVSTAAQSQDPTKDYVICVYSAWNELPIVRQHLGTLRSLGITGRLSYKRDNETWVRSKGGNAWYWSPEGSEEVVMTRFANEWQPAP